VVSPTDGMMPIADPWGAWVPGPRATRNALCQGLLSGRTFAVKDLIDVEDVVTGGGNPDWTASHGPAPRDAETVRALRLAGAAMAGKTITDELAFSLEGENAHHGTPINPKAPDRLPGGSSSGSAVAVSAGLVDFALGTDTGGSVRVPASFCGVFGFRPTHGAVSLDGVIPFAPSYDTIGWMARDGALLERIGRVLLPGSASADASSSRAVTAPPSPTLMLAEDAFALADPACAERVRLAASRLGASDDLCVMEGGSTDWLHAYATLQGAEIHRTLGPWMAEHRPRFGPEMAPRFAGVAMLDTADIERWTHWRAGQIARLHALLAPGVALLMPTTPGQALPKSSTPAERGAFYATSLAVNSIAGHAGLPQATVPLVTPGHAPYGLSIVGAPGSDLRLLTWVAGLDAGLL